ncbi:MAG: hypothetical protein ACE5LD_05880, partial [Candidatus Bipolaricaulia bacterium]
MQLLGFLREERWLILGLSMGLLIALLPPPAGLSVEGMRVLAITVMAVIPRQPCATFSSERRF